MAARVKFVGTASKLVAVFLTIIVSIGYVPLSQPAYAAEGTYTTFDLYETGDYDQVFAFSDLHLTETSTNRAKFAQLLNAMDDAYDPDMLLFCGDPLTTSYTAPSASDYPDPVGTSFTNVYQEIRAVADYYLDPNPAIVFTTGNHDSDINNTYFTNNSGFSSYYGLVPTQNFDVFMFGAPAGSYEDNSQEQIDALDTYLNTRADENKPVFVIAHFPIDDTSRNTADAAAIQNVLAKYDQPIFFLWGHNHTSERIPGADFSSLFKSYDLAYSTVNVGAINYRNAATIAQGLAMTFDYDASTLDFDMMKVVTGTSGSTVSGTHQVTLPSSIPPNDAQAPNITSQPSNRVVTVGGSASLSVGASVAHGVLSYQWYSNTTNSTTGGTSISGAKNSGFSAPTSTIGERYYYCVVTNTFDEAVGNKTATVTTNVAKVTVNEQASAWDGTVATAFAAGTGTQADPYLVSSGAELAYLVQQVNAGTDYSGKYIKQTADIDLDSREWMPVGKYVSQDSSNNRAFAGIYDGDGYIISNLFADQTFEGSDSNNKAFGVFGYVTGTVMNLGLNNADVSVTNTNTASPGNAYAGGLIGYLAPTSSNGLFNCFARGTITATTSYDGSRTAAGGLAGYLNDSNGTVSNCYSSATATISGTYGDDSGAGSAVGNCYAGTFSNTYWDSTLATAGCANVTDGLTAKTTTELKAAAFVTLLNANKGTYKTWIADTGINGGFAIHERQASGDKWTQLAGSNRYGTMAAIVQEGFATADTVIIATGANYPDALAAAGLAGVEDAPIILTPGTALGTAAQDEIERLDPDKALVIGGISAIDAATFDQIEALVGDGNAIRVSGDNRYKTALAIYDAADTWSKTAIVASGYGFADALSISPYAFAHESPIFLTGGANGTTGLDDVTKAALTTANFDQVIIVGGPNAVSADTETYLEGIFGDEDIMRLSGDNRYQTSAAIATYALGNGNLGANKMAVATGQNFPDALAGSTLCGTNTSVLLLVDDSAKGLYCVNDTITGNKADIFQGYFLGGDNAVTPALQTAIRNACK